MDLLGRPTMIALALWMLIYSIQCLQLEGSRLPFRSWILFSTPPRTLILTGRKETMTNMIL